MKKLLSVLLTIIVIFSIVPIGSVTVAAANNTNAVPSFSPLAEEIENNKSLKTQDEYIYYSDLFYGYSHYLNNYSLSNHHFQTQMAMSNVFSEYVETPAFGWAGFSETLNLFSSMSDLAKAYTDKFGLTDFQYKDDLDAANKKFVANLFALKMGVGDGISDIGKTSSQFDGVISTIEKLYKAKETDTLILSETITLVLTDAKVYCKHTSSFIPSLNSYVLEYLDKLSDPLDTASEIFEFAAALATSIAMEDVRLELINDIIKTQDSDSILYEGMTRLLSQLNDGYIGYFVDTYFTNKIIDEITKGIAKNAQKILLGSTNAICTAVTSCVGLINDIIFDWILGDTFSTLEDYRVTMILSQYSDLLYDSVINKQKEFAKQFETLQITEYETLFDAYISATEFALEQCANLAYYNSTYDPSYVNNKIYTWCRGFTYYDYINNIKNTVKAIPLSERNFVNFGELKLSNIQICYGSDKITNNCFYFVNRLCNANITLYSITIEEGKSFTVNGDVSCITEFVNYGELTVCGDFYIKEEKNVNNGTLNLLGNVKIQDAATDDAILTNYGTVNVAEDFYISVDFYINHGITEIKGDLNVKDSTMPLSAGYLAMDNPAAILYVGGDVYGNFASAFKIKEGTVVLNGTQQQTVANLTTRNLIIENPCGIKYDGVIELYGFFDPKGNPIDTNEYYTYLYPGATLADNNAYGKLVVAKDMELTGNFKANLNNSRVLTVSEGKSLIIDGNVYSNGTIKNNGTFEVKGNLDIIQINNFTQNDDAVLKVGGDLDFGSPAYYIPNGTIILNGTQQQTVANLIVKDLIIENPCGIKYDGVIELYGFFDPKGNPIDTNEYYTYLYPGATLADNNAYGKLVVAKDMELTGNFKANLNNSRVLTIPEGKSLIVDGNVYSTKTIKNNGTFEVKGNLDIIQQKLFVQNDDAVLKVSGDLNFGSLLNYTITKGTIILNGTQQQTVANLNAKTVAIENESEEGIVFNSPISSSVLFNHNQNKFTLYNNGVGSTFVDYDGDGMKDNIDPFPTIFCMCDNEGHIWLDATCTEPKICNGCGKTEGEALGHNYADATCTEPKTCTVCGKIDGESHGHKYTNYVSNEDATCTADGTKTATCERCDEVSKIDDEGSALGHDYADATCTDPKTCTVCGDTDGAVLGHDYDSGKVTKKATCKATGIKIYTCSACEGTKTETVAKLTTHTYSNNCDKTCNVCGKTRTVGAHKYTNKCDTTCNYCNAKRTIKHTYSNNCDTSCNVCKATRTITHTYKTTTTKATLTKNGSIVKKCTVCGKVASNTAIKYAKTFKLSTTTYTYNGKVKTPSVTVKDSAGKTLKKNTDYTVTYASSRKNVGTYKVTIKMKGKYSGTKTLTFKINPAKTTVSKLTAGKKSITVAITKKSTQVTGYQIQHSTSKKFTNAKTKTISSYKTTKYTLKSLSAKKTYYVRVRTYKTVGKTKYYSGWSTYKYVKTK